MNGGQFQTLCNAYLLDMGFDNLEAFGSVAGTNKTSKGTPDAYICTKNNKYILIECTTENKDLESKVFKDIEKCLNYKKTKLNKKHVDSIWYFHTSSNLSVGMDKQYKDYCNNKGVRLKIIGLDTLANDLLNNHKGVVKDFLNISFDTNQILNVKDFVSINDGSILISPLKTKFKFREEELKAINEAFNDKDIVVLSGGSGIGKTRLAIEYAKKYISNKTKIYCIRNNGQNLFDDVSYAFSKKGNYFVIIDDANQLSSIDYIVRYVSRKNEGYNTKILITVRDYAIKTIEDILSKRYLFKKIQVPKMSNKQIEELVRNEYKINNYRYLNRIKNISNGNPRVALLTARIAVDNNNLSSINDITHLYKAYYGEVLDDNNINNSIDLMKTCFILAFFDTLYTDRINELKDLLNIIDLSKAIFEENVYKLHECGLVDVYKNKIVKFEDQCFRDFIFMYVLCDKKYIILSNVLEELFNIDSYKTVYALNTILEIFYNKNNLDYITYQVKIVLSKMKNKNDYFSWIKAFFPFWQKETLLYIKNIVDSENEKKLPISKIDFEKRKIFESNDYIDILGKLSKYDAASMSIEILLDYYEKRNDLSYLVYDVFINNYKIDNNSYSQKYNTQHLLIDKFIERADRWKNKKITLLFIFICKQLLKLHNDYIEQTRNGNSINICNIDMIESTYLRDLRNKILENVLSISKKNYYKKEVKDIINEYGRSIGKNSNSVVKAEHDYIEKIIINVMDADSICDCLMVERIIDLFKEIDINYNDLDIYIDNRKHTLYTNAFCTMDELYSSNHEYEKVIKQKVSSFYKNNHKNQIKRFFEVLDLYKELKSANVDTYDIKNTFDAHFDYINDSSLFKIISKLINNKDIRYIEPHCIEKLFNITSVNKIYNLIVKIQDDVKDIWLFSFFQHLPMNEINRKWLDEYYVFLESKYDKNIKESAYRDISFLYKYLIIDQNVIYNSIRIIEKKYKYSPFMFSIYLLRLFIDNENDPNKLITIFNNDIKLLHNIYLKMNNYLEYFDEKGIFLIHIVNKDTNFVEKYIKEVYKFKNIKISDKLEKCKYFIYENNYMYLYDLLFSSIVKNKTKNYYLRYIFGKLLANCDDEVFIKKRKKWIEHFIKCNYLNIDILDELFLSLSEIDFNELVDYYYIFVRNNNNVNDFKNIFFWHSGHLVSNEIEILEKDIIILDNLSSKISKSKYIEHLLLIDNLKEKIKNRIELIKYSKY